MDNGLDGGSFTEGNTRESEEKVSRALHTDRQGDAFWAIAHVRSQRWLGSTLQILDKPIPDVEFPCVNESTALKEKIGLIAQKGLKNAPRYTFKVLLPTAILSLLGGSFVQRSR